MKSKCTSDPCRIVDKSVYDAFSKDATPFLFKNVFGHYVPGLFLHFVENYDANTETNMTTISDAICYLLDMHYYPVLNLETGEIGVLEGGESIRAIRDPMLTYSE